MNLAMGVWELNLLPPLAVLSVICDLKPGKGALIAKGLVTIISGDGASSLYSTVCLHSLLGLSFQNIPVLPRNLCGEWKGCGGEEAGKQTSMAHLYILCFLSNSGSVILAMRWWLLPYVEAAFSVCMCVCRLPTTILIAHLAAGALTARSHPGSGFQTPFSP